MSQWTALGGVTAAYRRTERTCPECGRPLQRFGAKLSCSGWPRCLYSEPVPEEVIQREAGQVGLFDAQEDE